MPPFSRLYDTEDIVRSYRRDDAQSQDNDSDGHVQDDSVSEHFQDASDLIPEAVQPCLGYLSSGGGEIYVHESGHDSFNDDTAARDKPSPAVLPPEPEPLFPVSQRMKADLISNYIRETATWCETTDSDMHFSARSVHRMMKSTPFVAAAMSLASRQLDTLRGRPRQITLELYQYTVRLLLSHDPTVDGASILATCTLLCVYEMMVSTVAEWRRHLQGCAGLLRMRKWNDNSPGIFKTCFWAFARIGLPFSGHQALTPRAIANIARVDVWASFILNQTTLIPTDSWVEEDSLAVVTARSNTDDYCNFAIPHLCKNHQPPQCNGRLLVGGAETKGTGVMEGAPAMEAVASTECEAADESGCGKQGAFSDDPVCFVCTE
ncbi:hypothetical protein CEP54_002713 [Fusarium duplospermum]|uniref:Uncharacterized protein n=1 Tax=Fusarium duplospermum TaxID=1325734 RepID=A0A428QTU0_9HYPO|nr:hypothetical protein CEP54_002713 [Fusarium duplospermum]